jgi:hypothetical protein
MKKALLFIVLLGLASSLVLVGCGQKEQNPTESTNAVTGGNPLTAPVDYLGTIAKGKITSEKTIDTVALNQALQMFNVQEGRYPKDLNELVEKKYMRVLPEPPYGMKIVYDPNTGTVKVVRQ